MMLIRTTQLNVLAATGARYFVDSMCLHLRTHFPGTLAHLSQRALERQVALALARARSHGLHGRRDCCRYLNLAVTYGWDFEQRPEHAWMRRYLADARISVPGRRLQLLVEQCLHREAVAAHNQQRRQAFLQQLATGATDAAT